MPTIEVKTPIGAFIKNPYREGVLRVEGWFQIQWYQGVQLYTRYNNGTLGPVVPDSEAIQLENTDWDEDIKF